jgi:hypothetical protein
MYRRYGDTPGCGRASRFRCNCSTTLGGAVPLAPPARGTWSAGRPPWRVALEGPGAPVVPAARVLEGLPPRQPPAV